MNIVVDGLSPAVTALRETLPGTGAPTATQIDALYAIFAHMATLDLLAIRSSGSMDPGYRRLTRSRGGA